MLEELEEFSLEYSKLSDKDKDTFKYLINKLIDVNYLTGEKEEDTKDYYFIANNYKLFKNYLSLSGIDLNLYKNLKIVVLTRDYGDTLKLKKIESAILLILRLLYSEKFKEITLNNKVIVRGIEIRDKYEQIGIKGIEKLTTSNLAETIRKFKKYNLVNYKGQDFKNDDFLITIYPTIQYAISISKIEELTTKLETYKERDQDEEISED